MHHVLKVCLGDASTSLKYIEYNLAVIRLQAHRSKQSPPATIAEVIVSDHIGHVVAAGTYAVWQSWRLPMPLKTREQPCITGEHGANTASTLWQTAATDVKLYLQVPAQQDHLLSACPDLPTYHRSHSNQAALWLQAHYPFAQRAGQGVL